MLDRTITTFRIWSEDICGALAVHKKEGQLTQPLVHKRTRPSSKVNEEVKIDLIDF